MKKDEVPQDMSSLGKITREVCYATDDKGQYTTELSKGWDVKITALDAAWQDIHDKVAVAREKVRNGQASPLLLFMERGLMDIGIVAAYTGFWKWQIRRHLKPSVFNKLSEKRLQRYAEIFNVSPSELKSMTVHED
ncbi:MAG: hypothetical protein Q8938_05020 [Bacteroidota bacterium]|nr:hypothetical protein [Bacteroidota bacterium]